MSEYGTAKAYSAYLIDAGRKTTPPFSWRSTHIAHHGPNRGRYSIEVVKALTISALI